MQKLSKGTFPYPSGTPWMEDQTNGSFTSLQTIRWMDAKSWFQLEFCFRDGKQHTGIINCQSTDFRKLDFHFNASLAAGNLAKAACKRLGITYSISNCKSFIHNAYMLERFICVFGINPDPQVIDKLFKELILFTARSA